MPDRLASALAQRLAGVLGLSTLAFPALGVAGCGNVVLDQGGGGASSATSVTSATSATSGGGAGGAEGAGGAGGAGGDGAGGAVACIVGPPCTPDGVGPGPQQALCFTPEAGPCPDAADALPFFPPSCASISSVQSACVGGEVGACCYNVTAECICVGRPFLVDRRPRAAAARRADDRGWRGDDGPDARDLPRETRDALAAAFTRDALGEHASIASFARFALELMAVGAPADLVGDAQRAGARRGEARADRLRPRERVRRCPRRPRRVPLRGGRAADGPGLVRARRGRRGLRPRDRRRPRRRRPRARSATDARVAALTASIAEDEARHAELAWRTMAWVLRAGREAVADVAFAALAGAARDARAPGRAPGSRHDLRAFGVLDAEATRAIVEAGIAGVVEPCARALREAAGARSTAA